MVLYIYTNFRQNISKGFRIIELTQFPYSNFQRKTIQFPTILITVGQGTIALAVGAGGGGLDIFTLIYPFSSASPSLWETARYRLKYCLKGPLNPKQPTNHSVKNVGRHISTHFTMVLYICTKF